MHKMKGSHTDVHRRTLTIRMSKAPAGTCFFCAFGAFLWPSIPVFRLISPRFARSVFHPWLIQLHGSGSGHPRRASTDSIVDGLQPQKQSQM